MRRAMAEAEVGDDVYLEDPTLDLLQEEVAGLLGFEAGLFVPSGTMGNAIAIRVQTRPGQEVLADALSHVVSYELSGMAVLSGVMPRTVRTPRGHLLPEHVEAAVVPAAYYRSRVSLAVLENTHNLAGGTVLDAAGVAATIAACRVAGFGVHVDGARLWNAAAALGVPERDLVAGADTVMVCFSKGLAAPVGSLLVGSRALIEEARVVRKQLGGGMRQAGVLAAAALVAIRQERARLSEDHDNARLLAAALAGCPGVDVAPGQTNIVVARLATDAVAVAAKLRAEGILVSAMDARTLRVVTHRDVDRAACERAADRLRRALS
jgi:threonine aldolase